MLWLKKYNLKLNFPALKLKFNSNYCAYNCFSQYIFNYDQLTPHTRIIWPMFKYRQLTMEKILDIGEPIYAVNKAKILDNWSTALPLRKQTPPKPQVPYIHPLNPS